LASGCTSRPSLWILRGGLAFLGILAAGVFFWFFRKSKAESDAEGEAEAGVTDSAGDTKEVDMLVHDAVRKLRAFVLRSQRQPWENCPSSSW